MPVYLKDEMVLLDGDSVATSSDCCCGGVCCDCDGNCDDSTTQEDCEAANNQWIPNSACSDDPPPCGEIATGACCDGTDCAIKTEQCCNNDGGTYRGDDTTCDPNPCADTGACCHGDGTCSTTTEEECDGIYHGDGTTCSPNPCPTELCCFNAFAGFTGSGRKYQTATRVTFGTVDEGGGTIHTEWNSSSTILCSVCQTCSGSGSTESDIFGTCDVNFDHCGGDTTTFIGAITLCGWTEQSCPPGTGFSGGGLSSPVTSQEIISDQVAIFHWDYADATGTATITLSDECIPL